MATMISIVLLTLLCASVCCSPINVLTPRDPEKVSSLWHRIYTTQSDARSMREEVGDFSGSAYDSDPCELDDDADCSFYDDSSVRSFSDAPCKEIDDCEDYVESSAEEWDEIYDNEEEEELTDRQSAEWVNAKYVYPADSQKGSAGHYDIGESSGTQQDVLDYRKYARRNQLIDGSGGNVEGRLGNTKGDQNENENENGSGSGSGLSSSFDVVSRLPCFFNPDEEDCVSVKSISSNTRAFSHHSGDEDESHNVSGDFEGSGQINSSWRQMLGLL